MPSVNWGLLLLVAALSGYGTHTSGAKAQKVFAAKTDNSIEDKV